jgi:hypothetical protein
MPLVISASRLLRKIGHVRVLGFSRAISSALRLKRRSRSARSLSLRRKKASSARWAPAALPTRVTSANLKRAWALS